VLRRDFDAEIETCEIEVKQDKSKPWQTNLFGSKKEGLVDYAKQFVTKYKGEDINQIYKRHKWDEMEPDIYPWNLPLEEGRPILDNEYNSLIISQKENPILIYFDSSKKFGGGSGMRWYYYKDEFWITNELQYEVDDMKHLIDEILIKEKDKLEKAEKKTAIEFGFEENPCQDCGQFTLIESRCMSCGSFNDIEEKPKEKRSRRISQDVKDKVWNRDKGKCVECDSNENLEFDHIIPVSKGGANTYRNLQLLCENCNRSKSDKIG